MSRAASSSATSASLASFRQELQAAVNERHQANHPVVEKWARGEVKRETVAGAIREHYYWLSTAFPESMFNICCHAPDEVARVEMELQQEETNPDNPHLALVERFCAACGIDRAALDGGRGLPTTEAWSNWERKVSRNEPWIAGVAAVHIASEAQEPMLFSKILPALREVYKFSEHDLEYWWLHAEADIEHGGMMFELLERHCDTREKKDLALHWAREGARMKYFFWDGININYEMGYRL